MSPYAHLLSPLKIGNVTLKNRMLNSKCVSSDEMEPELSGPFYEHLARNGAALVCVGVGALPDCDGNYSRMAPCHMDDPQSRKAYMDIIDKIHAQGSLATASMMAIEPQNVMISDVPDWNAIPMTGDYSANLFEKPAITAERLEGMIRRISSTPASISRAWALTALPSTPAIAAAFLPVVLVPGSTTVPTNMAEKP